MTPQTTNTPEKDSPWPTSEELTKLMAEHRPAGVTVSILTDLKDEAQLKSFKEAYFKSMARYDDGKHSPEELSAEINKGFADFLQRGAVTASKDKDGLCLVNISALKQPETFREFLKLPNLPQAQLAVIASTAAIHEMTHCDTPRFQPPRLGDQTLIFALQEFKSDIVAGADSLYRAYKSDSPKVVSDARAALKVYSDSRIPKPGEALPGDVIYAFCSFAIDALLSVEPKLFLKEYTENYTKFLSGISELAVSGALMAAQKQKGSEAKSK